MAATLLSLCVLLLACTHVCHAVEISDLSEWLERNHWPSGLPRSYYVDSSYFPSVPADLRPHDAKEPEFVLACNKLVAPTLLDAYRFQTEELLTTNGLNLYDGACWQIALALTGKEQVARSYMEATIRGHRTLDFSSIKADAPCRGIITDRECDDDLESGECGYCYGDGAQKSLDESQSYFFRMVSDVYAFAGVIDARCPELGLTWTWNDYRPVTGENAWAQLIGPLQMEYMLAGGDVDLIDDHSAALVVATSFVHALEEMYIPSVGCVYYAPRNTWDGVDPDIGSTVSIENNVSALAGLQMLRAILGSKKSTMYSGLLPAIDKLIEGILRCAKDSFDAKNHVFRQGGRFNHSSGVYTWNSDTEVFAVDCQTWVMAVLGKTRVDTWFGKGSATKVWEQTKRIGGYNLNVTTGFVDGVGFSNNEKSQVFSGEWSYGAANMLRVFANQSTSSDSDTFLEEAIHIEAAIETELTNTDHIDGKAVKGIKYANKRYEIPFGWWANPLSSTASTAWGVFLKAKFNPFSLGGGYAPH